MWGRGRAQLESVEFQTLARVSSENDQWSVRDMGMNLEQGTGHELSVCESPAPHVCSHENREDLYTLWCPVRKVGGLGLNLR